jgi:major membrane immunogen (membrane-anchored lipoprotein)
MKKRIINLSVPALLAVLCMIVLLTSCGGSDSNDDGSNDGRRTDGSYQFETTVRAIGGDNSVMKLTPSKDG